MLEIVPLAVFRAIALVVFVAGIAGMIIGTLADNNNGVVITFGLVTAVSAVVLMAVAYTTRVLSSRGGTVDEERAARVEERIQALVAAGAEETAVRDLVRDAVDLGRGSGPPARPDPLR